MIVRSRQNLIPFIKFISGLLTIVALGFVGYKIWQSSTQLFANINAGSLFVIFAGGSLCYLISDLLLVYTWHHLLSWFGETQISLKKCIAIYGRTQIAKYIPGNIFHLPNRHMTGWRHGLSHVGQIGAATYEIIGLLVASSAFALMGYFTLNNHKVITITGLVVVLVITLSSPVIAHFILTRIRKMIIPQRTMGETLKTLLPIWLLYFCFFTITGFIMWSIIGIITGNWFNVSIWIIFSICGIAWVAGFVTPGAPAGAGVRETILILILTNFIGEAASTSTALIFRTITVLGDIAFYLIAVFIRL